MKLKEIRIQSNKTQKEVAKDLNIAKSTYFNYENNVSEPNIENLIKIANYFNISIDYLVENKNIDAIYFFDNEEKTLLENYQALNQINKIKANSYILGLLANQN